MIQIAGGMLLALFVLAVLVVAAKAIFNSIEEWHKSYYANEFKAESDRLKKAGLI